METVDGIAIRASRYADVDEALQKIRFDILPAFAQFNPLWAGLGYGQA